MIAINEMPYYSIDETSVWMSTYNHYESQNQSLRTNNKGCSKERNRSGTRISARRKTTIAEGAPEGLLSRRWQTALEYLEQWQAGLQQRRETNQRQKAMETEEQRQVRKEQVR